MKASSIRAEMTVTASPKVFALCVTMLDSLWSVGERQKLLRMLCAWYGVTT